MNYRANEDKLGCRTFGGHNSIPTIDMTEIGDTEPVTLEEVKDHLRVTFADDDTYLTMLIKACRSTLERYCAISMVPKDVTVMVDNYEGFDLPYGPVVDVAEVITPEVITPEVLDGEGNVVTAEIITPEIVTPAIVPVVTSNGDAIEATFYGTTFRKLVTYGSGLTITYRAGYVDCPADLKLALLHEVAYQYENRGDSGKSELSPIAKGLAKMHRRVPKVL